MSGSQTPDLVDLDRAVNDVAGGPRANRATRLPVYVHLVTAGLVAQFMSGQSANFGLPLPLDRLLLPLALVVFWFHPDRQRVTWRPTLIHSLMALASVWCLISMVSSGTIASSDARFSFIDAYGAVPFALFLAAPLVYRDADRRRLLLVYVTVLGGYLSIIALLQGLRLETLIFPRYMIDPQSSHYGRAFGPSLQAGSNGLQLFAGMACSAALASVSRGRVRIVSAVVTLSCGFGLFLVMTRSLWLGALLGTIAALALDRRTRKYLVALTVAVPSVVGLTLLVSADVREMTIGRVGDSQSAFDRVNATAAALEAVAHHPVIGVGYYNFFRVESDWFWQLDTTPVAATGIAVHNVFLGHAAEIGIVGLVLWTCTLLVAAKSMLRPLPPAGEQRIWRQVVLGYFVCWLTAAMLMPISYALPSSFLWLFLGIISLPRDVGLDVGSAAETGHQR